jgi:hypothetical protein
MFNNKEIIDQWIYDLENHIKTALPVPNGREKTGYVYNSVIRKREKDELCMFGSVNGCLIPRLDQYVIMPIEELLSLLELKKQYISEYIEPDISSKFDIIDFE